MNKKQSDLFRDLDLPEKESTSQPEDSFSWDFGDLGKSQSESENNKKSLADADDFDSLPSAGQKSINSQPSAERDIVAAGLDDIDSEFSGTSGDLSPEASAAKIIVSEIVSDESAAPADFSGLDDLSRPQSDSGSVAESSQPATDSPDPVDAVLNNFSDNSGLPPEASVVSPASEPESSVPSSPAVKKTFNHKVLKIIGRVLTVVLETVLFLVFALYGVMFVLCKGPSPTARNLFVMSVRETSAVGFLAKIYFSDDEIAEIEARSKISNVETDTSLINMDSTTLNEDGTDAWGYVDDDGDGIILVPVKGEGYTGYMMIVLDPSRVILGSDPTKYGVTGYTVEEMVKKYDGVAGINAGGFEDPNGEGDGSLPETVVFYQGTAYASYNGIGNGFVGLDSNHILHVGFNSLQEIYDADIQYGTSFGPVLVMNGEGVDPDSLASGVNPRTAIGQRSDGAILLLVIDGRQVISLGATYEDVMNIMLNFGAVNACNLDGGSSSMMWYNDSYVNNCASVIGIRPVPTAFVVLKEGASND